MTLSNLSDKEKDFFGIGHQTKIKQRNSILTWKFFKTFTPSFNKYCLTTYLLDPTMCHTLYQVLKICR